jgi:hypothetical protein
MRLSNLPKAISIGLDRYRAPLDAYHFACDSAIAG